MSDEMSKVEALREKLAESEKRHDEYIAALRADLADALAALKPFANAHIDGIYSFPKEAFRCARAVYDRLSKV